MIYRMLFPVFICVTSVVAFAENDVREYKVTGIEAIDFGGGRLADAKAAGQSGKGYQVRFGSDLSTVSSEDLEILLKFRGLKDAKQLVGTSIKNSMPDANRALPYEILNAKFKGQYRPPTKDQFVTLLAKGFVESKDHCANPADFIDSATSFTYGQDMYASTAFPKNLQKELAKLTGDATVEGSECTEKIASRGPAQCFDIKLNNRHVTKFTIGPYRDAGISCDSSGASNIKTSGSSSSNGTRP
jgi:hypothetical protein